MLIKTYIGYWNNDLNQYPEFPMPIELQKRNIDEDLKKLDYIENHLLTIKVFQKGISPCRCCGIHNGCAESCVQIGATECVVIPEGYRHYIQEHNIEFSERLNELYIFLKENKYMKDLKEKNGNDGHNFSYLDNITKLQSF